VAELLGDPRTHVDLVVASVVDGIRGNIGIKDWKIIYEYDSNLSKKKNMLQ
jgi:hypothetical protein